MEKGANVNTRDNYGRTALHWAAWCGHEAVAKLLAGKSADVGETWNYEATVLLWVADSKCDFLKRLPLDISLKVLSYMNHRDLCRAAQVSKHWRNIIDGNESGWKELVKRDGYSLLPADIEKAIAQGWGWQDPVGPEGCEFDLSFRSNLLFIEQQSTRSLQKANPPTPPLGTSEQQRRLSNLGNLGRSKRQATTQDIANMYENRTTALAVPYPHLGLPSLLEFHLFKSLYRRHHLIRQSWTSGKVRPSHVAFAVHGEHVVTCLQFDDDKIISGSDDSLIQIYDTKTGELRKRLEGHEGGVWALQYEGNMLVSGSSDRSVRVWDIEQGICTHVFSGHTSTVRCLQILMPIDTGKPLMMSAKPLIVTGSRDSSIRIWRLPEIGYERHIQTDPLADDANCSYFVRALIGHTGHIRAISAHGNILISGSYDGTVRVWRISTGECLHVLRGHTSKVYSVVLDHKRNRCISGSLDNLVKIWDLNTGICLHNLEGHNSLVAHLSLLDERLVSGSSDCTLRIWDPENGRCKRVLMGHVGAITCFQHDGRKVISGGDRSVKMWDITTGNHIQDLLTDLSGGWQVKFDERRCVAAVQRDNRMYIEASLPFFLHSL
jgi:F-box and WD-40 domain protein CDC4